MSEQSSQPIATEEAAAPTASSVPERAVSDERYRHMGSERESHLQAIRGIKRRSLVYDDEFPGSWWETVASARYGPEPPASGKLVFRATSWCLI